MAPRCHLKRCTHAVRGRNQDNRPNQRLRSGSYNEEKQTRKERNPLPNVALIIPVGAGRTKSYLHNLQSLMLQSAPAFDLFVFNDCCQKDLVKPTFKRASRSNSFGSITVLNNDGDISSTPVGCGGARYYLYEEVRRKYDIVCSIDDDCQLMPGWVGNVLKAYEMFPQTHVFTTSIFQGNSLWALGMYVSIENGFVWFRPNKAADRRFRTVDSPVGASSIFCRDALNIPFDPNLHVCEDMDMYLNLLEHGISSCTAIRDAVMIHKPVPVGKVPGFRVEATLKQAVLRIYEKHGLKYMQRWKQLIET